MEPLCWSVLTFLCEHIAPSPAATFTFYHPHLQDVHQEGSELDRLDPVTSCKSLLLFPRLPFPHLCIEMGIFSRWVLPSLVRQEVISGPKHFQPIPTERSSGWIDVDLGLSIGSWLQWLKWESRDRHLLEGRPTRFITGLTLKDKCLPLLTPDPRDLKHQTHKGWVLALCLSPDRLRSSDYSILLGQVGFRGC